MCTLRKSTLSVDRLSAVRTIYGSGTLFSESSLTIIKESGITRCYVADSMHIIIIITTLFQEDNIFGTNAILTYGSQIQRKSQIRDAESGADI